MNLLAYIIAHLFVLCLKLSVLRSEEVSDFYKFEVKDIEGNTVSLEQYRGKVSLVVNVASLCGYTDSTYRALKRLQDILGYNKKFNVLAFPCNQFGEQEPHEDEVIHNFVKTNYDVEFPIFSKIDVIGENAHPAFKTLISQSSVHPDWNFYKYLVDHNGKVLKAWSTKTTVEDIFDSCKAALDAIPNGEPSDTILPTENESSSKSESSHDTKDEL